MDPYRGVFFFSCCKVYFYFCFFGNLKGLLFPRNPVFLGFWKVDNPGLAFDYFFLISFLSEKKKLRAGDI